MTPYLPARTRRRGGRMIVRSKNPSSGVRPELDSAKKESATEVGQQRRERIAPLTARARSARPSRAGNGRQCG
jgi:hypothetical protein